MKRAVFFRSQSHDDREWSNLGLMVEEIYQAYLNLLMKMMSDNYLHNKI